MTDEPYRCTSLFDFDDEGEPCEVLYAPMVCILESPSVDDREANRCEGRAISEALRIAQIRHKVFDIVDESTFTAALEGIADFAAVRSRKLSSGGKQVRVPRLFLHISCHGNEDGIGLTNNDFINWTTLGDRILKLATRLELFRPEWSSSANLHICMSSCRGLHARRMATNPDACPFVCLIGCKSDVLWTDAVVAFTTFYHQAITKERSTPRVIQAINDAALAPDVFELVTARDVGAKGFGEVPVVVLMSTGENRRFRWLYDTHRDREYIPYIWLKDQVCDPVTSEPILDPTTGKQPEYFDDPIESIRFMRDNPGRVCQVERTAAQEILIRFARDGSE